ncbi:MAG TPA: hypothetical protein VFH72_00580, partial [Candidatus Baltobacteraceae bacterium]|nr:hypothetical protein [Candidatus Baltobacteraceae bacterium]
MVHKRFLRAAIIEVGAAMAAACSSGSGMNSAAPPMSGRGGPANPQVVTSGQSILSTLTTQQTIGSTSPSTPHDVNPYGLDVAKVTAGKISAGDLVVCDFNNPGNVQGTGTEIISLHPAAGSSPTLIA